MNEPYTLKEDNALSLDLRHNHEFLFLLRAHGLGPQALYSSSFCDTEQFNLLLIETVPSIRNYYMWSFQIFYKPLYYMYQKI